MKQKSALKLLITVVSITLCTFSCKKDKAPEPITKQSLTTVNISQDSVILIYESVDSDTNAFYEVDLNLDNIPDLRINANFWRVMQTPSCDEAFSLNMVSLNSNIKIGGNQTNSPFNTLTVVPGDTIGSNMNWKNNTGVMYINCAEWSHSGTVGSNNLVPFSIEENEDNYYGWFHFQYILNKTGSIYPDEYLKVKFNKYVVNQVPNKDVVVE